MSKTEDAIFSQLYAISVSDAVKQKNGLDYLPWARAWKLLKEIDPEATYEYHQFEDQSFFLFIEGTGSFVKVSVTTGGLTHTAVLPLLDFRSKPLLSQPKSDQVNRGLQRALTKAIGMHGLGLPLYEGEDLEDLESDTVTKESTKRSGKKRRSTESEDEEEKPTRSSKKRSKKEDVEEDEKPARRSSKRKPKSEDEEEEKPKRRSSKRSKPSDDEEEPRPSKKRSSKKRSSEPMDEEVEETPAKSKKRSGKKAAKKTSNAPWEDEADEDFLDELADCETEEEVTSLLMKYKKDAKNATQFMKIHMSIAQEAIDNLIED